MQPAQLTICAARMEPEMCHWFLKPILIVLAIMFVLGLACWFWVSVDPCMAGASEKVPVAAYHQRLEQALRETETRP